MRQTVNIYQLFLVSTDFLISINTFGTGRWCWDKIKVSWSSRQAFWNCLGFLDRRDLQSASVKIESLDPDKLRPPGLVFCKVAGFVCESIQLNTNQVILEFFFYKTNPKNKSFEHSRTKLIHEKNLLNTVGQNESMKQIFWTGYRFVHLKHRICMDTDLFIVRLCTKDLCGFVRICWIRENRLNLLKISLRYKFTNWIFWKHVRFVIQDT